VTDAPKTAPARPRHAASLVLVRNSGTNGPEVLMGKRPVKSRFAPDVFVFPGGAVDPADRRHKPKASLNPACAGRTGASAGFADALAIAAIRETQEETGLKIDTDLRQLTFIARAITPTQSPIRFHARFFLADAGATTGQIADSPELSELAWRPVMEALSLPLFDITEEVLRSLIDTQPPRPFFYSYRQGAGMLKKLLD
jgi:8-oxo-dGTP pyrophosphatase MutT (NUDIX family)